MSLSTHTYVSLFLSLSVSSSNRFFFVLLISLVVIIFFFFFLSFIVSLVHPAESLSNNIQSSHASSSTLHSTNLPPVSFIFLLSQLLTHICLLAFLHDTSYLDCGPTHACISLKPITHIHLTLVSLYSSFGNGKIICSFFFAQDRIQFCSSMTLEPLRWCDRQIFGVISR